MTPSPLQSEHAPLELAENSAASTALALAKALRTLSRMPVYVAVLDRREPRARFWSTMMVSGYARGRQPTMSDDLPEPATPETAVSTPLGIVTDTSLRLLSRACRILISPLRLRTLSLMGWCLVMWLPVAVPEVNSPAKSPW